MVGVRRGAVLTALAWVVSCGGEGEEPRQENTARSVESFVACEGRVRLPFRKVGPSGSPRFACGPEQCLFIRSQSVGAQQIWAGSRVLYDGTLVDDHSFPLTDPLPLGQASYGAQLAVQGDDFVLALQSGAAGAIELRRLDGGTRAHATLETLPAGSVGQLRQVLSVGDSLFVLHGAAGAYRATRSRGGAAPVTVELPASFAGLPALIPGPAQLLAAYGNEAVRLDALTGALLDAAPIVLTKHEYPPVHLTGFYQAGQYNLVFRHEHSGPLPELRAVRVRASDGAQLDPWDDFFQVAGSRRICHHYTCAASNVTMRAVPAEDGAFLFLGDTGSAHLRVLRLDGEGNRTDAAVTASVSSVGNGSLSPSTPAYGPQGGFVHANSGIRFLPFAGEGLPVFGDPLPSYGSAAAKQWQATMASNGRDFVVFWSEEVASHRYLMAARIDGVTGELLDPEGIQLSGPHPHLPEVAVTTDGHDYFIAFTTPYNWPEEAAVRYGILGADGSLQLQTFQQVASAVAVAFDGERYLLAHNGSPAGALRLSAADLGVLDPTPLGLNAPSSTAFAAAGNTAPAAHQRTFLVAYNSTGVRSQGIRSVNGTVLAQQTIGSAAVERGLTLTSNGTDFLAVWADNVTAGRVRAARIDQLTTALNGSVVDVFGATDTATGYGSPHPRVSFDGTYYHLVGTDGRRVIRRRFTQELVPVDAQNVVLAELDSRYTNTEVTGLAYATNALGRSLVFYVDVDAQRLGLQLLGRFLDENDLCPEIPDGGTGGSGGGGGTGGGAGTGGAPSTGGVMGSGGTAASGGAPGTGGEPGSGGTGGSDGEPSTGGVSGLGGEQAGGGTSSGGAAAGSGGNASGSGGSEPNSGGSMSAGGVSSGGSAAIAGGSVGAGGSNGASGGCSVTPASGSVRGLWPMMTGCLLIVRRRRRR